MGICETKEILKLHMFIKINEKNDDDLFNFQSFQYQKKLNYIIKKNSILYIDTIKDKIYFRNEIINNSFTKSMKKIQFKFDIKEKKIFVKYLNKEKIHYKNFLWKKKIRMHIKELLKIEALEEDYFRIGKYIFKIKKINKKNEKIQKQITKSQILFKEIKDGLIQKSSISIRSNFTTINPKIKYCRICLEKEDKEKNPFEKNLCSCSEKNPAHIKCLLIWLQKKCWKKLRNKQISYYDLSTLKCDLCLKSYPETVLYKNQKKTVFEIEMDFKKDFILFEILDIETGKKKGIYYIEPENEKYKFFTIGRNEKSLIKLEDNSVSINHSYLHYSNSNWFFIDRSSKHGTLKKVKDNYVIEKYNFCNQYVIDKFCFEFHKFFTEKNCKNCKFVFNKNDIDPFSNDKEFDSKDIEDILQQKILSKKDPLSVMSIIINNEPEKKIKIPKINVKIDNEENEEENIVTGRNSGKNFDYNIKNKEKKNVSFDYEREIRKSDKNITETSKNKNEIIMINNKNVKKIILSKDSDKSSKNSFNFKNEPSIKPYTLNSKKSNFYHF